MNIGEQLRKKYVEAEYAAITELVEDIVDATEKAVESDTLSVSVQYSTLESSFEMNPSPVIKYLNSIDAKCLDDVLEKMTTIANRRLLKTHSLKIYDYTHLYSGNSGKIYNFYVTYV